MKNEKILEKLHAIAIQLDDENKKAFDFCRKHPDDMREMNRATPCIGSLVADIIATVEWDISHDSAKKSGNLSRLKAAERVIKSAKKQERPALHGAWIADGMQYICDAYRAARFPEPLDLPKIPENIPPIDAARFFAAADQNAGARLNLPDVHTLKAYIKTEKAARKAAGDKRPPVWDFGENLPAVNAEFLLDFIELFPDATATANKYNPLLGMIYFSTPDGAEGVLLPVKMGVRK